MCAGFLLILTNPLLEKAPQTQKMFKNSENRQESEAEGSTQSRGDGSSNYVPSSRRTVKATKPCLNCRACKVKCDRALPACSRCVRRGEKCERGRDRRSWNDPREAFNLQLQVLRQLVNPSANFKEYAEMLVEAVRELHAKGGVGRGRAINTLRSWSLEIEDRGGFDLTWGALEGLKSTLGIVDADLKGPEEYPACEEGLPLMRLVPGYESMDVSRTMVCQGLDPTVPSLIAPSAGTKVLWMNEASQEASFSAAEINKAMDTKRCLSFLLTALNTTPGDRIEFMKSYAEFAFGTNMTTTGIGMVLNKQGTPVLRLGRWRYKVLPEFGVVCAVLTFEELPVSRYMRRPPKPRECIVDAFRVASAASSSSSSDGAAAIQASPALAAATATAATVPPGPSSRPPSPSSSSSSTTGEGSAVVREEVEDRECVGHKGVLPMTSLGRTIDQQRAAELWRHEKPRSFAWLMPAIQTAAAAMGDLTGRGGGSSGGEEYDDEGYYYDDVEEDDLPLFELQEEDEEEGSWDDDVLFSGGMEEAVNS